MNSALHHDYADLGDVRLHYVRAGQGHTVVLLHGWPQTWYMWRDIIPGLAEHYRATPQDVAANEAFRAEEEFQMPIRCYGGELGRGRGMAALESWQRVAEDVRGGIAEDCGHWIPEERPAWVLEELLAFFGEDSAMQWDRDPL